MMKKKMGRPAVIKKPVRMHLTVPQELEKSLVREAHKRGVSRSELFRMVLWDWCAEKGKT